VQQHNEHPTIEQLSALLDQQLSPQEQAACNAHLRTCQQCQRTLLNLRQTVALLHALPQPELPRSFILPVPVMPLAERAVQRNARVTPLSAARTRPAWQTYLQRSTRVISTLAAVLGLIFILSGLLTSLPHGGASTTSGSAVVPAARPPSLSSAATSPATQPARTAGPMHSPHATATDQRASRVTPTPTAASAGATNTTPASGLLPQPNQTQFLPPLLDPSMPEGREGLGTILFVLGIVGFIGVRRRRTRTI